ncbi:hypothetical protein F7725_021216 [Dissostichus mawsoni]|uniref:Transcription elongation factor SPT5 n=1 Tax=Dissostichus mawsoni TaxID=36200 RepID=A0A7J5YIR8_DISMA|nr:hypothetical protein F7725_021216 [Dissostichus mawsoni]
MSDSEDSDFSDNASGSSDGEAEEAEGIEVKCNSLLDVDDEYEDEEDQWEEGAEDILEKGSEELSDDITQQQLLPGVKYPLQIKSVVAPDHVKGYIYVESYKQTHVKAAIEGIGNLRMGLWNQQMVPIKEMTDVLKVVKEVTNLKPKSWVDYVEPSQNTISLKMIPRIDLDRIKAKMSLITDGVKPTLSELEKFEDQPEGIDLEVVTESGVRSVNTLQAGDNVEDPLEFPAHELRKYFRMGDHVKVIAGRYEGDTGLIVRVLNMHGKVMTVKHQSVNRRKDNRFAVALDSEQNNIHVKDIVKVIDGPHSGREGEIRHLFRGFAFLHCKKLVENGGMFVCKTRHLVLAGGLSTERRRWRRRRWRWGGRRRRRGMGRGRGRRDNDLIGYIGVVKDATESTARVELHSTYSDVRDGIQNAHVRLSDAPGSRTPHYGSQTPLHDGSRTPGQSGAWDPSNPNTPSRNDEEYDFGYDDEPSPSPQGYTGTPNPQTPGYPEVPSPQVNPQYNPQTPGTPAMLLPAQPLPSELPPGGALSVGYSPMTPGAPSPGGYNPHTPGSNIEQGGSDWVTPDILGGMCSVFMQESEKVVSISSDHLEPVTPTKNNKVKVILGEDREATGILLSIDGDDGIVRMELDDQLKILNLRFLGRLEH